jgi:hypothetical protein
MGTRRVRNFNRTRRKYGGDKLGEGGRSIAYDLYSESGDSLYSLAKENNTSEIELIFPDGKTEILENSDQFLESLKSSKQSIGKIIKPSGFLSLITTKSNFMGEIENNQKIINAYGLKNAKKYTTLTGIELDGKNVSGAIFSGKKSIHAIFNVKCVSKYDMDIKQFTVDILESLNHFSENHNDIKLDNIVKCSDKYKLIDWDKTGARDKVIRATTYTTNPVKLYLIYGVSSIVKLTFGTQHFINKQSVGFPVKGVASSSEFKELYSRIMKEYEEEISSKTKKELLENYKDTFDTFSVGMTLFYAIYHFKLDYQKYRSLINSLTSLKDPLNAKQALALSKKFFNKD